MSRFVGKQLKTIYLDGFSKNTVDELIKIAEERNVEIPSHFTHSKLVEILKDHREWIKIVKALSFENMNSIQKEKDDLEISKKMLSTCIKEWNFKDEKWNIPEVNEENILTLDVSTIAEITEIIEKEVINTKSIDKKKLEI